MILTMSSDWPAFWAQVNVELKRLGYANSTRRFYRQVLRLFARHAACPPTAVNRHTVRAYLRTLTAPRYSPHWTAMNISVLRTVFDRLCGLGLLHDDPGPRMPQTLPEILSANEVVRLLESAPSLRDRLILGLLFGCGLKISELRNLRWMDLDIAAETVTVRARLGTRTLPLPRLLVPLLSKGVQRCPADAFLLAGAQAGRPLSARWIQALVRRAAEDAGLPRPITAMTLRHTYAVQSLEAGSNVRELQESLGHRLVQSTMRYLGYLPPALSPLGATGPFPPPLPIRCPADALAGAATTLDSTPLLSMVRSTAQFLSTLRMQIGVRLFAPYRAHRDTGPP